MRGLEARILHEVKMKVAKESAMRMFIMYMSRNEHADAEMQKAALIRFYDASIRAFVALDELTGRGD